MNSIVAIHQPNFFPWLGYFDKIIKSDTFIILDDVQFPKTNGTWINRVQLIVSGEPRWITAPINRNYHGILPINQTTFDEKVPWRSKFIKTIESNYKKADYYSENIDFLSSLINNSEDNIARYNSYNLLAIVDYLGLKDKKILLASEISIDTASTQRLIDITKKVGGNTYLCGGGASGYQEDELYMDHGIFLTYQNFKQTEYAQKGMDKFYPGLSVIDALLQIGKEKLSTLMINNF